MPIWIPAHLLCQRDRNTDPPALDTSLDRCSSVLCPAASSLGRLRAGRVLVKVCTAPSRLLRRPLSTPTTISTSPVTHEGPTTVSAETRTPRPLQRFSTQDTATAGCETLPTLGRHADTKRGAVNRKGSKDIVATQTATWIHLGGLPPETNRVDIIRAMLAAGPTGRVLAVTLSHLQALLLAPIPNVPLPVWNLAASRRLSACSIMLGGAYLRSGVRTPS